MSYINQLGADGDDMRFGVSALDLKYKSVAEPDELMVRETDGKIFYKRADGHIVSGGIDYDADTLVEAMACVDDTAEPDAFIAHHIIDIAGRNDLNVKVPTELNIATKFVVLDAKDGFYFRVHGDTVTNNAVTIMRTMYDLNNHTTDPEVSVVLEVEHNGAITEYTVEMKFNQLIRFSLDIEDMVTVRVKSICYPKIFEMFATLNTNLLNSLRQPNLDNDAFEAAYIDFVTIVADFDETPIFAEDGNVRLNMLIPVVLA